MRAHTDKSTVVYHEDGSWTESTEVTHYPASKAQKATATLALVGVLAAPLVPILTIASIEKAADMREKYRAKRDARKNKQ